MNVTETQPIVTSATVVALITALIALFVAFGVPITDEQKIAVIGIVGVLAPLATIWYSQRKTTPLADPKVTLPSGESVKLVRSDNQQPTPQAMQATKEKWERGE